jgi:hypothetical protein
MASRSTEPTPAQEAAAAIAEISAAHEEPLAKAESPRTNGRDNEFSDDPKVEEENSLISVRTGTTHFISRRG